MLTHIEKMMVALMPYAREAMIRATIWAFIGLLYAMLFASFAVFAQKWQLPVNTYFFAAIMAGTIGALMYSSMRLVVFIAVLLFPISIIYFGNAGEAVSLNELLKIMIPAGLLIGAAYGRYSKKSRVCTADAKTLAGFTAGLIVALLYLLVSTVFESLPIAWVVGVMSPLTGMLYVMLAPKYIERFSDLLPPVGDGALVGASVAVFISMSLFLMAGSIDVDMAGALSPEVSRILEVLPTTAMACMIGSGIAGAISGFRMTEWQDM